MPTILMDWTWPDAGEVDGQSDTDCYLAVKQVLGENRVDEASSGRHRVFISYSLWHDLSPRNGKATDVATKLDALKPSVSC